MSDIAITGATAARWRSAAGIIVIDAIVVKIPEEWFGDVGGGNGEKERAEIERGN